MIAIYKLNGAEVKEQQAIIARSKAIIAKHIELGDLMDVQEVTCAAKAIKEASVLINEGIITDNEFMIKGWSNHPQVTFHQL